MSPDASFSSRRALIAAVLLCLLWLPPCPANAQVDVPHFWQGDPQWEPYNPLGLFSTLTIASDGCAISSIAMVLAHHQFQLLVPPPEGGNVWQTAYPDPGIVNLILKRIDGYAPANFPFPDIGTVRFTIVEWDKVCEMTAMSRSYNDGIGLTLNTSAFSHVLQSDCQGNGARCLSDLVNQALLGNMPSIVGVADAGHYVVVESPLPAPLVYRIDDPGSVVDTNDYLSEYGAAWQRLVLYELLDVDIPAPARGNRFAAAGYFAALRADTVDYLKVYYSTDVAGLVTSASGARTGVDRDGVAWDEIPGAFHGAMTEPVTVGGSPDEVVLGINYVWLPDPEPGDYTFEVFGDPGTEVFVETRRLDAGRNYLRQRQQPVLSGSGDWQRSIVMPDTIRFSSYATGDFVGAPGCFVVRLPDQPDDVYVYAPDLEYAKLVPSELEPELPHETGDIINVYGDVDADEGLVIASSFSMPVPAEFAGNHFPEAGPDEVRGEMDVSLHIPTDDLLANDVDPDDDPLSVLSVAPTPQTHGTVALTDDEVVYTPESGQLGTSSFIYTVGDGQGGYAVGVVSVEIVTCFPRLQLDQGYLLFDVAPGATAVDHFEVRNAADAGCAPLGVTCDVRAEGAAPPTVYEVGDPVTPNFAAARCIGNLYRIDTDAALSRIETYLDVTGPRELDFFVLSAQQHDGPYALVASRSVTVDGTGAGYYASTTLNAPLAAGTYCIIGVGWNETTTYYYDQQPDVTDPPFGEKLEGFRYDDYPIPPAVSSVADMLYVANYCQRLHLGGPWLGVEPASGSVVAGDSAPFAVRVDATGLDAGLYLGTVSLRTDDPQAAVDSVSVLMAVGEPENPAWCAATPDSIHVVVAAGRDTTVTVAVSNDGSAGSALAFQAHAHDHGPAPAKSVAGSTLMAEETGYGCGDTATLHLSVYNGSTDQEWLTDVVVDFPPGVSVNYSTDFVGGSNGDLETDGATGDGVAVTWHGDTGAPDYYGVVLDGETASAIVNVTFAGDLSGDLVIPYTITGDGWNLPPHQIDGQIVLTPESPEVFVVRPNGVEALAVGASEPIRWLTTGCCPTLRIDLSRDGGTDWTTIAAGVDNDGLYVWSVAAPASADCRIRVCSDDLVSCDESDRPFWIYQPATWMSLRQEHGLLGAGESQEVLVAIAAGAVPPGSYVGEIIVQHNGQNAALGVPIVIDVLPTGADDIPAIASRLWPAAPNPFNPRTSLRLDLAAGAPVTLRIYDMRGRLVRTLWRGPLDAGSHGFQWRGRDDAGRSLPAGVYCARVVAGDFRQSRKVVLVR